MKFFEKKPVQPDKKPASPDKSVETRKSAPKMPETKPVPVPICVYFLPHSVRCEQFSKSAANRQKKWSTLTSCSIKRSVRRLKALHSPVPVRVSVQKFPPPAVSGGPGLKDQEKDQDPFLSLSGDEFDVSLLDGLDEQETPGSTVSGSDPQLRAPRYQGLP